MAGKSRNRRLTPLQVDAKLAVKDARRRLSRGEVLTSLDGGPVDPAAALQRVFRASERHFELALANADAVSLEDFWVSKYDAQGNVVVEPHPWAQEAERAGSALSSLAIEMMKHGLAEKMVNIEEAKVSLLVIALEKAIERAGLPPDQRLALGRAVREELAVLDAEPVAA